MKRLIVNADDFGMTSGVNRAILQAHQSGIVTSTTLMATGSACDDAIAIARSTTTLDVGAHIVLLEGRPLLPAETAPWLLTADAAGRPQFRRSFGKFCAAALTGSVSPRDVYREATAQIASLIGRGLTPSHLDTHKHAHAFPAIFRPLLQAAADCGVPAVRNPFEPAAAVAGANVLGRPHLWWRLVPVTALRAFAREFRECCRRFGVSTTEGTLGITLTGYVDQPSFETLLRRIPGGTWELLCHPAYEDEAWWSLGTKRGAGAAELGVLTSSATRLAVAAGGIECISYRTMREEQTAVAA